MSIDAMLDRLRDGDHSGDAELLEHLRRDPAARRALRQRLALDGALQDLLARPGRQARPAGRYWRWVALAALLLIGLALPLWHLTSATPRPPLLGQDLVSHGSWRLEDGSRLELDGSLRRLGPRQLELSHGRVVVNAQPQPTDDPLRIETPQATVTIVGTVFSISCAADQTEVEVEQGTVAVSDRHGRSRLVLAGGRLRVDQTGLPPLVTAAAISTPPGDWSVDLGHLASSEGWFAEPTVGGLAARRDARTEAETRTPTWRVGAPERWDGSGFGTIGPHVAIDIEFSLAQPRWVLVVFGCWEREPPVVWRSNLQHGANFPAGRHQLRATWAELDPSDGRDRAVALGAILRQISVVTGGEGDPGLVVHRIDLRP